MSIFSKLRIPYSQDLVYGFIFLALILVPTLIAPQVTDQAALFTDPLESLKLVGWSILCGLALIILSNRVRIKTILPKYFIVLLLLLMGWVLLTLPFSLDKANSIVGVANRMNSSLWFFTVWTTWIFLLSTVTQAQFKVLLKVLVLVSGAVAVLGIFQSYGVAYYAGLTDAVRQLIPSFLGNPNFVAMFLAGMVPIIVWLIFTESNRIWRLVYIFIATSYIWSLVLLNSRAALLGAGLALVAILILSAIYQKWRAMLLVLGAIFLISTAGYFYLQVTRPEFISGNYTDQSTAERFYVWDYTTHIIKQYPIVGTGLGNYFIAYRQNDRPELAGTGWFDDPHNVILYIASSGGIPLALIFLAIVVAAGWQGFRRSIIERASFEAGIWLAAMVAWLVAASFGPVSIPNWLVFGFFIIGLFRAMPMEQREIGGIALSRAGLILGVILIVVGLLFTTSEILSWQSEIKLRDGNQHSALKLMSLAVDFNPANAAAVSNWAIYSRLNGDYDQADQALVYAQKLHPRSAGILESTFQEYIILWKLSNNAEYKQKALDVMNAYELTNKNYFITYRDVATGYMALGDYDRALDAVKKEVVMANQNYQAWVLMAQIYQLRGDRDGIIFAFREAFRLHPSSSITRILQKAEKEPDINKIILPYNLPTFDD